MKTETRDSYAERMLRVLVYISRNLDQPLDLDHLASIACFSPYHFHRIFRGMVGESVMSHIRRLRLERSAWRLKLSTTSVTDLAFEAGFESLESYSRAFKSLTGKSPSAFRKQARHALNGRIQPENAPSALVEARIISNQGALKMKVEIKKLKPIRAAFMRHTGPYNQVGATWERLCEVMGQAGELGPRTRFFGICYDDPEVTSPEQIRYDACIEVDENFKAFGEVGVQIVEGGDYAMTTHFGPYQNLNETYAQLMGQWLPRHGLELRSLPSLEFYLNDPENTDPQDLVTDIYTPIEPQDK